MPDHNGLGDFNSGRQYQQPSEEQHRNNRSCDRTHHGGNTQDHQPDSNARNHPQYCTSSCGIWTSRDWTSPIVIFVSPRCGSTRRQQGGELADLTCFGRSRHPLAPAELRAPPARLSNPKARTLRCAYGRTARRPDDTSATLHRNYAIRRTLVISLPAVLDAGDRLGDRLDRDRHVEGVGVNEGYCGRARWRRGLSRIPDRRARSSARSRSRGTALPSASSCMSLSRGQATPQAASATCTSPEQSSPSAVLPPHR